MRIARVIDTEDRQQLVCEETDGSFTALKGEPLGQCEKTGERVEVKSWLSPVTPTALFCIGLNYQKHAEESGVPLPEYPVLFMKNRAAATGHLEPIRIPKVCDDEVDYEAELAVIIGKTQLTEGAYGSHHPLIAAPVNPWSQDAWSGVSSSGSGVAVAAGLAYAALGSVSPVEVSITSKPARSCDCTESMSDRATAESGRLSSTTSHWPNTSAADAAK